MPGVIVSGQLHHVAVTFGGFNKHLYVDGREVGVRAQTGVLDHDGVTPVHIAAELDAGSGIHYYFGGIIDELQIYDRVLSLNEIIDLGVRP